MRALNSSEEQNQQEYTNRSHERLRKEHALQSRQQPKELKVKEMEIRKQYRAAMKTQTIQYKALDRQMKETMARDEYRDLVSLPLLGEHSPSLSPYR